MQDHIPWRVDEDLDIRAPRIAGQMRYAASAGRGLAVRAQQDWRDRQILPQLDAAAPVTIAALIDAGVCAKPRDGVKILGKGALAARLAFEVAAASKSAVAAIEGTGGSIVLLKKAIEAPVTGA